jgi:hypothetical protein
MMGLEPTTAILEGWHSAIELHPQYSFFSSASGIRTHTWLILSQLTLPLVYRAVCLLLLFFFLDCVFKDLVDCFVDRDVLFVSVDCKTR